MLSQYSRAIKIVSVTMLLVVTSACEKKAPAESSAAVQAKGAKSSQSAATKKSYSPYVVHDFPQNVYFGDTHLHTNVSLDAFGDGNTTVTPDKAYRWAKGKVIAADDGMPTRISRPLDFLVVSDHAVYSGIMKGLSEKNKNLLSTKAGARWAKMIEEGKQVKVFTEAVIEDVSTNKPRIKEPEFELSIWKDTHIAAAEAHNEPGKFTAFIGFEYTSTPKGGNLHRVVVFKDGGEKAGQVKPFSAFDSEDPEKLWEYLADYEKKTGGRVLAIPHNGNLSNGAMFALQDFTGKPLTRDYAERRMRWEPIYEATQYKGDSETHPVLSPDDEFANFEPWDKMNLAGLEKNKPENHPYEYARSALKLGLQQHSQLGVNPFKFGLIGATDSHTGFAAAEEDNFLGKYGKTSPNPKNKDRWKQGWPPFEGAVDQMAGWEVQAGGLAGVWATENTREALFDAMKRKEVYATTGPRMRVRMFGSFDYRKKDALRHDLPAIAYRKGVPMGGDLPNAPKGKAPTFLVSAMKDPDGANLDRVQIIKGWLDNKGKVHERIYDVAVSDDRKIVKGKVTKRVGSTVDLKTATYTNTIGDAQLSAGWTDPDFDPKVQSFYYTRVLEIPTPRWTAFDEVRFGIKMAPEVVRVLQERAYTSPIWYTPK